MHKNLKLLKSYISCYLYLPFLYGHMSYSQEGEDLILERLFEGKTRGFYIDIGAYHPFKYSNTQKLYEKGWNGINIEPNYENWRLFNIARKRDINLNFGIGHKNSYEKYFTFDDPALNTFEEVNYQAIQRSGQSKFIKSYPVRIESIKSIMKNYIKGKSIDLVNIDAEGSSNMILRSMIKEELRPKIICIERDDIGNNLIMSNKTIQYMSKYIYHLYAATNMSYIFKSIHFS